MEIWDLVQALDLLCLQVVEVNMINKSFTNNDLLQAALTTFTQTFTQIMFQETGYWGIEDHKRDALHNIYTKRVKSLIQLQRKDKLYMMIEQVSTSLVLVYQHTYKPSKEACLFILDDLIHLVLEVMVQKLPPL